MHVNSFRFLLNWYKYERTKSSGPQQSKPFIKFITDCLRKYLVCVVIHVFNLPSIYLNNLT